MDDEKNCFHRATPKFHINYDELTSTSLLLSDTNTQNSTFLEKKTKFQIFLTYFYFVVRLQSETYESILKFQFLTIFQMFFYL